MERKNIYTNGTGDCYISPNTSFAQVELEDALCTSANFVNETNGIEDHGFGDNTHSGKVDGETTNGIINYEFDDDNKWI